MGPYDEYSDGTWLCENGPYKNLIKGMSNLDPMLTKMDKTGSVAPAKAKARVAVLDIRQEGIVERQIFDQADALRDYIQSNELPSTMKIPQRRVFIVEGLAPGFVSVLGSYFLMDPRFFVRHQRTLHGYLDPNEPADMPPLPSLENPKETFSIKYYELRSIQANVASLPFYHIGCADSGRRVTFQRIGAKFKPICVVRRKCSFWRRSDSRGGWDGVFNFPRKRYG
jgi:hypothetical protein